jgi:hypothetical protein
MNGNGEGKRWKIEKKREVKNKDENDKEKRRSSRAGK